MRHFFLILTLALPALALGDAAVPVPHSDGKPPRHNFCYSRTNVYPQCGIMGPPCCLGEHLLLPTPGPPLWPSLEYAARILGDVAAIDPEEAREQLVLLRKDTPAKMWPRFEKLLRADKRLSGIVTP
jgi:hypothetical protein